MSNRNVIRAWKDPVYRNSLSEAERSAMPANPAGSIEISDEDLGKLSGGDQPPLKIPGSLIPCSFIIKTVCCKPY